LEHNQILKSRNVDVEALRSIHGKKEALEGIEDQKSIA